MTIFGKQVDNRQKFTNRMTITLLIIYISGFVMGGSANTDLHIGGLFPLSGGWFKTLGGECLQAAQLAVEHINNHTDILPGYNFKLDYNDTMASTGRAVNILFDYLTTSPAKVAILGSLFSSSTKYTAEVSGLWGILQVAYGSTTPALSNRKKFPYFFRTISSANDFGPVRLKFMNEMGWDKASTLTLSEEPYGEVNSNLQLLFKDNNITLVGDESFKSSAKEALERLKAKDARVIFGNFFESSAAQVFCDAYTLGMYGPKYVWVVDGYYTPGWWNVSSTSCSRQEMLEVTQGYFTVVWNMMNPNGNEVTISGYTTKQFRDEIISRVGHSIFTAGRQHISTMTYDAAWSIALALNASIDKLAPRKLDNFTYGDSSLADVLLEAMSNISFTGVSGPVSFSDTGDREGIIVLEQFKDDYERTIGYYIGDNKDIKWEEPQLSIWDLWGGSPPPDEDDTQVIQVLLHVNRIVYYIYTAFASLGMCLAMAFLVFNIVCRKLRVIKMSSPNLNNSIVIGCIICFGSVIVMGLDTGQLTLKTYQTLCQASPWVICIGFTLAFGAMFAKTWRVYSIFTNKTLKKKTIKDWSLFIMVGVFLCVDIIILSVWQGVDPLTPQEASTRVQDAGSSTATLYMLRSCDSSQSTIWTLLTYCWKGLLMVFGMFITWQTRNVSIPGLNDSKYIGFSIYNVVIFSVIGAPLSQFLNGDPNARFLIIGGFIIFCTISVLCLLFIPKILAVKRGETGDRKGLATATSSHNHQPSAMGEDNPSYQDSKLGRGSKVAPEPSVIS